MATQSALEVVARIAGRVPAENEQRTIATGTRATKRILSRTRPWRPAGREIVFDGSRNDPFCTVLLEPVSEAIDVSTGSFPAKPDGLTYPLGTGPDPDTDTVCPVVRSSL
jgi:hypothetical protein